MDSGKRRENDRFFIEYMKQMSALLRLVFVGSLICITVCGWIYLKGSNVDSSFADDNHTVYVIGSKRYEVPVNYQFTHNLFHGVTDGSKSIKVDSFSISALLPNLDPYTDENKQQFLEGGYGNKINILVRRHDGEISLTDYLFRLNESGLLREGDKTRNVEGLTNYILTLGPSGPESSLKDLYVSNNNNDEKYMLARCKRVSEKIVSPSCFVRYVPSEEIVVEYYMHRKFISRWSEINNKIKLLINGFGSN